MARYDVSEAEWRLIAPLAAERTRGVARVDDRRIINAIFHVLRTGSPCATCRAGTALHDRLQSP